MTPQQTINALPQTLRHCPEDQTVDTLPADLTNRNPETTMAADLQLEQHGLTLPSHQHDHRTHLDSIRRNHPSQGATAA